MNKIDKILLEIENMENELQNEWNYELAHKYNNTEVNMDIIEGKAVILDKIKNYIIELSKE